MSLETINTLYSALQLVEQQVKTATVTLSDAQKRYDKLSTDLADTMAGVGVKELTMYDGRKLALKTDYFASAAQERMSDIREYLKLQGSEGMIKAQKINLSDIDPKKIPKALRDRVEYNIHPSTLKAWVREMVAKGPLDPVAINLFKIHTTNTTVLT